MKKNNRIIIELNIFINPFILTFFQETRLKLRGLQI